MFEIHPAADDKAALLARQEGLSQPLSAMILTEKETETGYILYRTQQDTVEVLLTRCEDPELEEWLVRAALNAAANRHAVTAACGNSDLFALLRSLGFEEEDGKYTVFIPDFFNRPCAGGCSSCDTH
jgi:hypothetical protein